MRTYGTKNQISEENNNNFGAGIVSVLMHKILLCYINLFKFFFQINKTFFKLDTLIVDKIALLIIYIVFLVLLNSIVSNLTTPSFILYMNYEKHIKKTK